MDDLAIQDKQAISQFKSFLFKQKEEFVKLYYQSGKVFIHVHLAYDVLHLKDYFATVVFNDFKDFLVDKFVYRELDRMKVEFIGFLESEMYISLSK